MSEAVSDVVVVEQAPNTKKLRRRRQRLARRARNAQARDARQAEEAQRAVNEPIIEREMLTRGFTRHSERPGHWRSLGGFGHDLEIRHRKLACWMRGGLAKLTAEVDGLIRRQLGA